MKLQRMVLICHALLIGVGHIRARVSKRGKNWSKGNHQTPCYGENDGKG